MNPDGAHDDRAAAAAGDTGTDAVTGAFSYSGAAIAGQLLAAGRTVRTLTGHPGRRPPDSPVEARPLHFDDPAGLADSLTGVTTLFNTYWVRFAHGGTDHAAAVRNSATLFQAARTAGVRRIVHVSITNPSLTSPYPYFRGKAEVEQALAETGVPWVVLRPAILFGGDGVLVNNIAWLLRRFPVFAVGGTGRYRIRGIHVDELARLALGAAAGRTDPVVDAVGPERPTFNELVQLIKAAVHSRARVVRVPGTLLPALAAVVGRVVHDRVLTTEEYRAMADGLADVDGPSTGAVRISDWIAEQGERLGTSYANELSRHFDRIPAGRP
jgi:NADH dehydrogenase